MNIKECIQKSIYITNEYYNNNIKPYFDYMTDNVIWHGPAIGQNIKGLDNMREAWKNEQNVLTFSLGDIDAQYIQTSASSCEVMLMFMVTTHYPNGDSVPIFQRIQFSWGDRSITDENGRRKRVSKIFMIHISNPIEQHSSDFIYPIHYNEMYRNAVRSPQEPRITLRGIDNAFYVLAISSIVWAESQPDHHCIVHLRGRNIKVKASISDIEKLAGGALVRVHSGYIVNPGDVVSVQRFNVSVSDGSTLPVPEKKYTTVKKQLIEKSC